ncbi:exonuclease domain-containing protein [Salinibius halmophilus]|uniref:exonuclease domain-containing protein n=1 Tax=Salinibius halmophilus TaxID=1853216 RepID=UPI000E668D5E|nr:exonuclease domain-containing protein [Salinibius halmophilus]
MFKASDVAKIDSNLMLAEAGFVALDLELTSLDTKLCDIVSIGVQPFDLTGFKPAQGCHWLVRADVGSSAVVHQTTDNMLADAPHLSQVLPQALLACEQKIVVVHNRFIEQPVLARFAKQLLEWRFAPIYFDTMAFAMRKAGPHRDEFKYNAFTLENCRADAGLPNVPAHNALVDAQATAELCIAQCAQIPKKLTIAQAQKHFV